MKKVLPSLILLLLTFRVFSQVDVGATALVNPTSPQCGASNQTVIVTITNFSPATINFAINNVTVNVGISGASIQTYNSPVISSGTLSPGASMNVVVTNSADLSAVGTHIFNITTVNFSDVNNSNNAIGPINIAVNAPPTTANAGPDAGACTSSNLAGNTPVVGLGTWTLFSGSGTITSPNSPTSGITGLGAGPNTFVWTISNAPCPSSTDTVVITGPAPPTPADAGPDQTFCAPNATLSGNTPTVGTGVWTLISGSGTFTTPNSPTTAVTGLGIGPNTFRWTTSNAPCLDSFDDVVITGDPAATLVMTSAPGTDAQTVCVNTAIAPITYAIGGSATGASASGLPAGVTGSFAAGTFTISGTPTAAGTFNYTVTTSGGACTPITANGTITVNPDATIILTSAPSTDAPTVCINNPITPITYSIGGGGTGASVIGLPTGVTGSFAAGTFTISGTPTVAGTFNYTVTTSGTCAQNSAGGTITVSSNATIALTSAPATAAQTVCINNAITAITYSIGGGATGASVIGLPTGVTGSFAAGTFTISGTPTAAGTFNYTVTTTGSCLQASSGGTITVNPDATITLTSAPGTDAQTICINTAITNITYNIGGGATGASASGLPAGVTGSFAAGTFTISGTPTVAGIFNYTVTTSGGICPPAAANGTINVTPNATITLTSAPATAAQTVCINNAITAITYSIGGGGTGASVTGLPTGVTGSFAAGTFTISGTPTVAGTFNYTVTTTGFCIQASLGGTITVNPDATITLTSAPATAAQTVCINAAITNITYSIGGGGTGASVTGLPTGVTGSFAAGTFTISGTPTVSGTFNYTVTTTGTCAQTSAGGTITVNPNATIALTSAPATAAQTVCINNAITAITYSIGGGGTGASASGLPAGVTGSFAAGTFTISGTPTVAGTFNYTVTTTGTCVQASSGGTITVNPNATIALTSAPATAAQTVCINNAITAITYSIGGGGTGASVIGLPTGVTGSFAAGTFTISGTPTVAGTFNYTITTTGTCAQTSAGGTITVNPNATIALTSAAGTNNQNVCSGNAITAITYSIGGGGTGASAIGLPTGVTGSFAAGIFTISGTPTVPGVYNYTVTATGSCLPASAGGTITVASSATITLTSAPGTNAQMVCLNAAITNITYSISGSGTGATVSGLPAGVTGSFAAGTFTISGTPTVTGTFNYTVTSTGGSCPPVTAGGTITIAFQTIALTSAPFTNDQEICFGDAIADITYAAGGSATGAVASGLPAGLTTSFSAGVLTISGTPSETGTFYYTVTTSGNCTNASAIGSISINPVITGNTSGTSTSVCSSTSTTLVGGTVSGGNGSYMYLWESGPSPVGPFVPASGINNSSNYTTDVLTIAMPTVYYRRTVTSGGCSDIAVPASVTVDSLPAATAGGSAAICSNGAITVSGATATAGSISWSHDGSGSLTNGTTLTPTYTAAAADAGNTVILTMTVSSTNSCAPSSDTAPFTLAVQPVPVASVTGAVSSTICANGGTVTLLGATASNGAVQWTHDGQGTLINPTTLFPSYTAVPADAGDTVTLLLIVSDTTGCGLSDTAVYTIIINPIGSGAFVDAGPDQTISLGTAAQLDATGPAITSWQWTPAADLSDPNIPDPEASPLLTTVYQLTATDVNGCMATDSVTITVIEDFSLIIANLVTPDGDSKNDTWIIQHIEYYPNTSVTIVNREGIILYESDNYDNSWGGTYHDKIVPDGTYYYIVRFQDSDRVYKGAVNIIQN